MRVVIQVSPKHTARGWGVLVRHWPGTALPNRMFLVSEEALQALRKAGVKFREISREPDMAKCSVVELERL